VRHIHNIQFPHLKHLSQHPSPHTANTAGDAGPRYQQVRQQNQKTRVSVNRPQARNTPPFQVNDVPHSNRRTLPLEKKVEKFKN